MSIYSEGNQRIILTRTPLRITFVGGGTDIPAYYKEYGPGAVISAAMDKYIYILVGTHFYKDELRLSYSKTENAVKKIDDIQHPTLREALRLLDIGSGVQVVSMTEVPSAGTGLGSSSSFLVGVLNALHAWKGEFASPDQLAEEAVHIEREVLKEAGGKQDQYMAAFGGIQLMEFNKDESVAVKPAPVSKSKLDELNDHLLLLYTGIQRDSTKIHVSQRQEIGNHLQEYARMKGLAYEAFDSIVDGDMQKLGKLLDENWQLKRKLSGGISDPTIDGWYNTAIKAGALGGKIIGAGGGGFMMFLAPPERHQMIKAALKDLHEEKFRFESSGSRIVYTGY